MSEYHKIQSIYKRDMRNRFIDGAWSKPELGYLAGLEWTWTEKVDGTNIRIMLDEQGRTSIGGRTDRAQIPATLLQALRELGVEHRLRAHFNASGPVTLYGEGYGAKIQKAGGLYRPDQGFVLFDVRVGQWWLSREDVHEVAVALGLERVPVVLRGSIYDAIEHVVDMRSAWGDFSAEGVVGVPSVPLFARDGSRIIVKVKGCDIRAMRGAR